MSNSPLELLGRVNAKTGGLSPGAGGGSIPEVERLTPNDISAALAGLPRGPYLLARAKFCGDASVLSELYQIVIARTHRLAERHAWSMKRPDLFANMATLALLEVEITPQVCKQCKGRGHVLKRKPKPIVGECPRCGGSGKAQRSDRARARHVDVHWKSWTNTWSDRYLIVRTMLWRWEAMILKQMLRRIRG